MQWFALGSILGLGPFCAGFAYTELYSDDCSQRSQIGAEWNSSRMNMDHVNVNTLLGREMHQSPRDALMWCFKCFFPLLQFPFVLIYQLFGCSCFIIIQGCDGLFSE